MSNIVKWGAISDKESLTKVRVEFSFGDGSTVQKTVTMADFIRAMSTIEAECERCMEIGQIPRGFYDGVLIQNKEQSFDVLITVSAHLGVIYMFGVPKQVVFPDLVFLFQVREGKLSTSFCFALKQDASGTIGPTSRLCYYPFGNVYDNGKICWGNTVFPKMTSIKDTEKLIQAFFDAETNNDLYQNRIADHPEFREQSGLLEALKEMEVFPQEWLIENGNQLSNLSVAIRGGK